MLYLCATPIGNLEDITYRAVRVLSEVSCIFAEDTRHSLQLINHLNIKKPLYSCHEHNEAQRAIEIVERVKNGEDVAYISDAGMPCISDPGHRLVCACIEAGVEYTIIPGACACVSALALSGLDSAGFTFFGFLPRSGKERNEIISRVIHSKQTSILYESPNRVSATCADIAAFDEVRELALVREITKLYEESVRGTAGELAKKYADAAPKGECVIVVAAEKEVSLSQESIDELIRQRIISGMSAKEIAKSISAEYGLAKNEIYKRVLELADELNTGSDE